MSFQDSEVREGIKNILRSSVIDVVFTKADGSERTMKCTLSEEFIPARDDSTTSTRKSNPDVCPVWDMENQAWRSFRWDSVKKINL